jgi:N-methylhydantoinase A
VRHDYVRTVNKPLGEVGAKDIRAILEAQIAEGKATIARERVQVEGYEMLHRADMQFQGQSHILSVALPELGISREQLHALFEAAYWSRFGVELKEIRPVLVNLHTAVIGKRRPVSLLDLAKGEPRKTVKDAEVERRQVWFPAYEHAERAEGGWLDTPVYRREYLPTGAQFTGPAIIEQLDATTVVEPGNAVELDTLGNLIIKVTP